MFHVLTSWIISPYVICSFVSYDFRIALVIQFFLSGLLFERFLNVAASVQFFIIPIKVLTARFGLIKIIHL